MTQEQKALALRMLQTGASDAEIEEAVAALVAEDEVAPVVPVASTPRKQSASWGSLVASRARARPRTVGGGATRDREDPFGMRSGGGGRGRRLR